VAGEEVTKVKNATLYMETTKISVEKTAGQITALLAKAGAVQTMQDYGADGKVVALTFSMNTEHGQIPFRLPINAQPIFNVLSGRRQRYNRIDKANADLWQAERVAWRQILRWIEAQLALVATGMVKIEQVFLPYIAAANGETLYERFAATGFQKLLPRECAKDGNRHG
jgi:hypothetical protein